MAARAARLAGCCLFNRLGMGTNLAVEQAQHVHSNLLRRAGCLRSSDKVCYRKLLARGPLWEILVIDDHVGIMSIPKTNLGLPPDPGRRGHCALERAAAARVAAGPRCSKKKEARFKA